MVASMTGFGSAQGKNKNISLSIQIKTVNGRFLETKFRMPKSYLSFETELKTTLSSQVQRGSVDIFVHRTELDAGEKKVLVDTSLAKGWIKAAKSLSKELGIKFSPSFEMLLKVPDLFQVEEPTEVADSEKKLLTEIFAKAVADCVHEKKQEGERLRKHLKELLHDIEKFVTTVESKKSTNDKTLRESYEKKLQQLVGDERLDPARLNQEALFLLERADISEELARLKSHLDGFANTLASPSPVGKKLDFIVQEMHREVNTIGSKSQLLDIMKQVIEAKSSVEKLREQVQNIE